MKAAASDRRDRLRAMLADLKMPGALEAVDGVLAQVDSGAVTAGEAIELVLNAQIALRNNRRLQAAMRSSRLPAVKTLAEFDFTFQPSIKREQIESLHELGFLSRAENVILLGPPGVGKTHLAISLAVTAAEAGRRVYYGTLTGLIDTLMEARAAGELSPAPAGADASCTFGRRRDRVPTGQPGRRRALLPADQRPARAGVDGADLEQGLRGVGQRARRRGHGGGAHRPAAAPLPHRQHPGQQLPDAGAPGLAAGPRRRSAARKSRDNRRPGSFNAAINGSTSGSLRRGLSRRRPIRRHRHDHATDTEASTDRDSRSRAGAAPRRPSAGVVVVRRDGPLQRGTGGRRRATVDTELPDGPVPLGIAAGAHHAAAVLPVRCCPEPPTPDVANVGGASRLSPVRYVTVWSDRGVDERGAAGALPGATAGRRVPGPVPPAGGSKVAATAVERRGADAPGAAGRVPGMAGRVAGIPRRVRDRGVARSGLRSGTCRYWKLSSRPGASGVTARPPATSFRLAATKRSWAPASGRPSMTAGSCSPVRTRPPGRTAASREFGTA